MKTADGRIRSAVCHADLQAGPSVRRAYTMADFEVSQNYNGTLAIRRIVMVYFQSSRIVMAPFKKNPLGPCLVPTKFKTLALCKKKIPHHIKLAVYAWSTKC